MCMWVCVRGVWGVQMVGDIIRSGRLFTADSAGVAKKSLLGLRSAGRRRGFGMKTAEMASKGETCPHD